MEMEEHAVTNAIDQDQDQDQVEASKEGNVEEVRRALDADHSEVNTSDKYGDLPLYLAVKKGCLPCVKLLVSKKTDVNMTREIKQPDAGKSTTKNQEPDGMKLDESWVLTDYGSPFLLACRLGHQSIVEFLFYNGADLCQTVRAEDDKHADCLSLAIKYSHEKTAKFLVTHMIYGTLLFLMRKVSIDLTSGRNYKKKSTPMRQLIQYMPDPKPPIASSVDIETVNADGDDVNSDDVNSDGVNSDGVNSEPKHAPNSEPKHAPNKKGQHPLALMQEQECHANLLTHPLSIKLIEHKWRILGVALNSVSLFVYLIFLAFLTGYVLVNPPSFYVKFINKSTIVWYYEPDKLLPDETYSQASKYFFGGNSTVILLTLVIFNIIKEILRMYSQGRRYCPYEGLLEWSIYVLTFLLVIPVSGVQYEEYELREKWQWECGALAIFLAWINIAFYVRQNSTLGIYVIMFQDVLRSTVQFLTVILLFIIAFALAFNTLLLNQTDFHSFWNSFLRTFAMTSGELDFTRVFHSQNYLGTENVSPGEDFILTAVFSNVITSITFVVFVITMPIIAMNLLVGVAVDDIHRIRQKAAFYYMKLKVDRVITAENLALGTILGRYIIRRFPINVKSLTIQLSGRSTSTFRTWFTSVVDFEQLRESVRAVCKRNQERKELRDQLKKSSCSHMKDQPDGRTDETLLQKLCQMRDQMQAQMQDQILKVNGLISQVKQPTG